MVVSFAPCRPRVGNHTKELLDLLIGGVRLTIENQDRYIDTPEALRWQSTGNRATNDGCKHSRIGSREPSRYEIRRGEVSGNNFPFFRIFAAPPAHTPSSKRTR